MPTVLQPEYRLLFVINVMTAMSYAFILLLVWLNPDDPPAVITPREIQ